MAVMVTTTTTMAPPRRPLFNSRNAARFLFGGAGLLLIFTGCSSDGSPAVGSAAANTSTSVAAAPSVAVDSGTATTTVAAAATLAPVDGAALLQQALAATGGGYHFNQTATLDGASVAIVDGDRLPDGARLTVSNESGKVSYIFTTDGVFLMPENGEWEADDSDPPAVDPINALAAPSSVAVAGNDGTTVQLTVTVPFSSLGVAGEGDVPLQVAIVGGTLSTITYTTTTADGKAAVTTTTIGPVVDPSPVVSPI
jgi:hypothetical protein